LDAASGITHIENQTAVLAQDKSHLCVVSGVLNDRGGTAPLVLIVGGLIGIVVLVVSMLP
jgi:hypothetical protein